MSYDVGFLRELMNAFIPADTTVSAHLLSKFLFEFVVDSAGVLRDVRWLNKREGVPDAYERNLLQRLMGLKHWIPGKVDGRPVNAIRRIHLHVNFQY